MTAHRDLAQPDAWMRSLERSRRRRALLPRARREHSRKKHMSAALASAMVVGPGASVAAAQVSNGTSALVGSASPANRAIEVREGGLPLQVGSQGELVAHVQRALDVTADGVFGPETDAAVRQYQQRAGIEVDGIVGPTTWSSLFESGTGASAAGAYNVPPQVQQRIEQRLVEAGQKLERQGDPGGYNLGPKASASSGGESEGQSNSTRDQAGQSGSGQGSAGESTPDATGESEPGGATDESAPDTTGDTGSGESGSGGQSEGGEVRTAPPGGVDNCGSSTIAAPVKGTQSSPFGPRWGRNHDGVDLAAPTGTAIRAAACGQVSFAGQQSGYGNMVCITHTSQFATCYAHMSRYAVSQGAQVAQGQVIGYVGCTGSCTGPHLHFETRVNGQAQNPQPYLNGSTIPGKSSSATASAKGKGKAATASVARNGAVDKGASKAARMVAKYGGAASAASKTGTLAEGMAPVPEPVAQVTAAPAAAVEAAPAAPATPAAPVAPVEAAPAAPVAPATPVEAAPVAPVTPAAPVAPAAAPVPVEAAPVTPVAPVAPVEATPAPVAPAAPVEAAPAVPVTPAAPVEAAPVEAAPLEAAPAPAPVEAAPVAPAPVEAAPVAPAPVEPAPVEAAPAPVEAAPAPPPVEAAPVEAAPAEATAAPAAPAEAVPAAPAPVDGTSAVPAQ